MGIKATRVEEQIAILKERGMSFEGYEESKVKEILLDIGYYRLGFYWFDFINREQKDKETFVANTNFKTIVDLYYLDNDIRYILIKYLNRIEVNFRTKLVYYGSLMNKGKGCWFVDWEVMNAKYLDAFDNYYNEDFKEKHSVIKKHHAKYPKDEYAPAWKTFENFPFGTVFKTYEALLSDEVKKRIMDCYNLKPIGTFEKVFKGLVHIRNRCAHGAVVYNYYLPKSLPSIPYIKYKDGNRQNLGVIILTISFILESISANRKGDFLCEIENCLANAD
ncbi:MAG: Abi family protein, partial [Flavobacterium sp.]